MSYKEFSYFYDYFNYNADYDKLYSYIKEEIKTHNIKKDAIVCDLGCGTGELTLKFCKDGFDVVAVDNSSDMLDVLLEKKYDLGYTDLLILNQDITKLDMFGTIDLFVCTFDTLNHLENKDAVLEFFKKVSLFMHPEGIFIFDMNSEYKHREVLKNNVFNFEEEEASCVWQNSLLENENKTKISISIKDKTLNNEYFEEFYECYYSLEEIKKLLKLSKLKIGSLKDGEKFDDIKEDTQRYIFVCKKEDI